MLKPIPDVKTITAHRQPTAYEIKFGYGAVHYADFDIEYWLKPDGSLKKWIKDHFTGLRFYR